MVKLGLTPEGNWTFYYFCNKVRKFNLRTNFMAIIASFTNIRSSCIATLNTFYERKKKKLFCWTIIFVERQANKQFQHSSKRIQGVGERREERKNKNLFKKLNKIWKFIWTTFWTTSVTPHQDKYSWQLRKGFVLLPSCSQAKKLVRKTPPWPLMFCCWTNLKLCSEPKHYGQIRSPQGGGQLLTAVFEHILMKWLFVRMNQNNPTVKS